MSLDANNPILWLFCHYTALYSDTACVWFELNELDGKQHQTSMALYSATMPFIH